MKGDHMIDAEIKRDARLPAAAYDLALRLGADPNFEVRNVRLTQTGRMKTKLDAASWMSFTAKQTIATRLCALDWFAHLGPFGLVSARDALDAGEGRLDVTALGFIPIARTPHTAALVKGELMRYLAEIPWAPDAILRNAALRWREVGPDTLAVSAGSGDSACEVALSLDSDGRIAATFAPDRPRSAIAPNLPTPWRGRFSDYRRHRDRWIPFAGEVGWEIEGKEIVYWQGQITHWDRS
ncbi:MAG: hypothetical protein EBZ50_06245 [Alphaproteobacteria bacterium]|nr:hypothetical protein [Alphaproteobacteria bacterium]